MTVKNPKCLVIDASILRAVTGKSLHPIPTYCRNFLTEIQATGHTVIVTQDIKLEWDKHIRSAFARTWYTNMRRKKRIKFVLENVTNDELRRLIFDAIAPEARTAVEKDMRLIEAAIQADEIISSLDQKMRGHFRVAALKIDMLKPIVWVNPTMLNENCIIWLRKSAPADDFRTLGYTGS